MRSIFSLQNPSNNIKQIGVAEASIASLQDLGHLNEPNIRQDSTLSSEQQNSKSIRPVKAWPRDERNNIEFNGQALVFDLNTWDVIQPRSTIGHKLLGNHMMSWFKAHYFGPVSAVMFVIFLLSSQFLVALLFGDLSPHMELVMKLAFYLSIFHELAVILLYDSMLLKMIAGTFEANFLAILTATEMFFLADMLGWSQVAILAFIYLMFGQLMAVYLDALHFKTRGFEKKWAQLMEFRKRLDHASGSHSNAADAYRDQHKGKDNVQNIRCRLSRSNGHILAAHINECIKHNPKWKFRTVVKWHMKVFKLFGQWKLLLAWLFALGTTVSVYTSVTFGYLDQSRSRNINLLWIEWTSSEIVQGMTFTSIIFYIKRIITMALYPLHATSLQSAQITLPIVPEWRICLNESQSQRYDHYSQVAAGHGSDLEASMVQPQQNIIQNSESSEMCSSIRLVDSVSEQRPSVSFSESGLSMSSPISLASNSPFVPYILLSSSGRGRIIDFQTPISTKLFGGRWTRFVRRRISKYFVRILALWTVAYFLWLLHAIGIGGAYTFYSSSVIFSMQLFFISISLMDNTFEASVLCMRNFDTIFIFGNLVAITLILPLVLPLHGGLGQVAILTFSLLSATALLLDAKPVSFRRISAIISTTALCHLPLLPNSVLTRWKHTIEAAVDCLYLQAHLGLARIPEQLPDTLNRIANPNNPSTINLRPQRPDQSLVCQSEVSPKAIAQTEKKLVQYFGGVKPAVISVGLVCWLILLILLESGWMSGVKNKELSVIGGKWRTITLAKASILNLILFMGKRCWLSFMHPYRCVSIKESPLLIPLVDSLVALVHPSEISAQHQPIECTSSSSALSEPLYNSYQ